MKRRYDFPCTIVNITFVSLQHCFQPRAAHDAIDWDVVFERIDTESAVCILPDDSKRIEDWTVPFVVGAKFQRIEKPNQHGTVVRPADNGMKRFSRSTSVAASSDGLNEHGA